MTIIPSFRPRLFSLACVHTVYCFLMKWYCFNQVVELAKAFEEKHGVLSGMGVPVDEVVSSTLSRHARVDLQPLCAFYGGILAQELVKISGKFTPIQQFFNFHAFEALPAEPPADTAPLGTRYDEFIAVFGKEMQERLGNLHIFMVGCGALGCEYVKNFALMGVCCGPKGLLTITDNDTIEVCATCPPPPPIRAHTPSHTLAHVLALAHPHSSIHPLTRPPTHSP
jgi:hypothetical protein